MRQFIISKKLNLGLSIFATSIALTLPQYELMAQTNQQDVQPDQNNGSTYIPSPDEHSEEAPDQYMPNDTDDDYVPPPVMPDEGEEHSDE